MFKHEREFVFLCVCALAFGDIMIARAHDKRRQREEQECAQRMAEFNQALGEQINRDMNELIAYAQGAMKQQNTN